MKKQSLLIVLLAFFIFATNGIVFSSMADYVKTDSHFFNHFMYYLTIIIMIGSGFIGYFGYKDLSQLSLNKKIIANIIFYIHLLCLAIFLGTLIYFITSA